jgi:hypothetical protein
VIATAAVATGMIVAATGVRRRASRAQASIAPAATTWGMTVISTAWLLWRLCWTTMIIFGRKNTSGESPKEIAKKAKASAQTRRSRNGARAGATAAGGAEAASRSRSRSACSISRSGRVSQDASRGLSVKVSQTSAATSRLRIPSVRKTDRQPTSPSTSRSWLSRKLARRAPVMAETGVTKKKYDRALDCRDRGTQVVR